ncbi:MAG: hypothetical protein ACR2QK_18635, partial [Acidimicrobiales bacterium]
TEQATVETASAEADLTGGTADVGTDDTVSAADAAQTGSDEPTGSSTNQATTPEPDTKTESAPEAEPAAEQQEVSPDGGDEAATAESPGEDDAGRADAEEAPAADQQPTPSDDTATGEDRDPESEPIEPIVEVSPSEEVSRHETDANDEGANRGRRREDVAPDDDGQDRAAEGEVAGELSPDSAEEADPADGAEEAAASVEQGEGEDADEPATGGPPRGFVLGQQNTSTARCWSGWARLGLQLPDREGDW